MSSEVTVVDAVDPDVDLHVPAQRPEFSRALPTPPGHFPWATFLINVVGCALIGVLMVLISDVWPAYRLLRPFLGVGMLGGFTTFSTWRWRSATC